MKNNRNSSKLENNPFLKGIEKARLAKEAEQKIYDAETKKLLVGVTDVSERLKITFRNNPSMLGSMAVAQETANRNHKQLHGIYLDELNKKKDTLESSVQQLEKLFKNDHFIMSISKTKDDEYKPLNILILFVDMLSLKNKNFKSVSEIRSVGDSHVLLIKLSKEFNYDFFNNSFQEFKDICYGRKSPTEGFSDKTSAEKFYDKYLIAFIDHLPEEYQKKITIQVGNIVTKHNINFNNVKNSNIQIGDNNSISGIKNITHIRDEVLKYLPELTGTEKDKYEILLNVDIINEELSKDVPNLNSANEALKSIRAVLEGITGSVIATGLLGLF